MPKSCNVRREFPSIKLNNGMKIPLIGLGTWGVSDFYIKIFLKILFFYHLNCNVNFCLKSLAEEATEAVKYALKIGYRLIDCAHVYQNEKYVGEGLKSVLNEDESQIKRFVQLSQLIF